MASRADMTNAELHDIGGMGDIGRAEIDAIFPRVAEALADALGCEAEDVKLDASLVDDLGAESIDMLDIVFRLERAFDVKIPRGRILEEARGGLSEEAFSQDGVLTEAGLANLRAYLSEVPAERFPTRLREAHVVRLFTAETYCRIVIRRQRAATQD